MIRSAGHHIADLIRSGDVSAARAEHAALARELDPSERRAIVHACQSWHIDPAGFGCAPPRPCPPDLAGLRAALVYGDVPLYPTTGDFLLAATDVVDHADDIAAHWRLEAIRARRLAPGSVLDCEAIERAAEARMHRAGAV